MTSGLNDAVAGVLKRQTELLDHMRRRAAAQQASRRKTFALVEELERAVDRNGEAINRLAGAFDRLRDNLLAAGIAVGQSGAAKVSARRDAADRA